MDIQNPIAAAGAYSNTAKITALPGMEGDKSEGVDFAGMVKESLQETRAVLQRSETMTAKAITGEANLTEVVTAVNAADTNLRALVAVRDRMIQAYQTIMRMPI